jgi:hypothetical protein
MDTNEVCDCAKWRGGRTWPERRIGGAITGLLVDIMPREALAHALAERHELPVPLGLYLAAAGVVIGLSFVSLAMLAHSRPGGSNYPKLSLPRTPLSRAGAAVLGWNLRAVGVVGFLLVIGAGLFGPQEGVKNIAPVLVWVIWWVGLSFLCALFANAWPWLNPWQTLFEGVERLRGAGARLPPRPYPARLASWPAVGFFLIFVWMELVWTGAERPRALASAVVLYSAVTWAGMFVFGRDVWLRNAEPFSGFFGILGRFAPISAGGDDPDPPGTLRPPALGLMPDGPLSVSMLIFILLMLAAVMFDGFLETPAWAALSQSLLDAPALNAAWQLLTRAGADPDAWLVTAGLVVSPLLLFAAFALVCQLSAWATAKASREGERRWSGADLARNFALTLVPISVAYLFAHYLAYLLLAGQLAIPLASDPFGLGWNLFGTALYRFDIGIISARTVWIVCLAAIVLGHLAAVYLAHRTALRLFGEARLAAINQIPLVVLMIGYTMSSLWILAQPIVVSPRIG